MPAVNVERQDLHRLAFVHREMEGDARFVAPGVDPVALLTGGERFGGVVNCHITDGTEFSGQLVAAIVGVVFNQGANVDESSFPLLRGFGPGDVFPEPGGLAGSGT